MRLLDQKSDASLQRIIIYLTQREAEQLRDFVGGLIKKPLGNHSHISSDDFKKEITVCIYDEANLSGFNDRSKKLIMTDQ
jgi:hypothetical protein